MRRLLVSISLVAELLVFAARVSPAQAAKLKYAINVPQWAGGAYSNDQTKAFERCTATKTGTGVNISYSVDRHFRWSITLSNSVWNFAKGAAQNAFLKIGDADNLQATAIALDKNTLEIQTKDPLLLFARIRVANQLRAIIGGLSLDFSLEGGEEVLSALTQCAVRSTRLYQNGRSKNSIFDSHDGANAAIRKEAATIASNIIGYSRIQDSQILAAAADSADLPADVSWKAGLVTGRLTVLEAAAPISDVTQEIIARSMRACNGGFFFFSRPEELNNSPIERIFVSCQTTESTTSSYHLIVRRPKLGYYIFTVFTTGSSFIGAPFRFADAYEAGLRSILMLAIQNP